MSVGCRQSNFETVRDQGMRDQGGQTLLSIMFKLDSRTAELKYIVVSPVKFYFMLIADTGFVNSTRTGPSLSELHPNIPLSPTLNIRLNEHTAFIPSPFPSFHPFSTLKA